MVNDTYIKTRLLQVYNIKDGRIDLTDFVDLDVRNLESGPNVDLGARLSIIEPNANKIARVLDDTKIFRLQYLEHDGKTLYIHLKLR